MPNGASAMTESLCIEAQGLARRSRTVYTRALTD